MLVPKAQHFVDFGRGKALGMKESDLGRLGGHLFQFLVKLVGLGICVGLVGHDVSPFGLG